MREQEDQLDKTLLEYLIQDQFSSDHGLSFIENELFNIMLKIQINIVPGKLLKLNLEDSSSCSVSMDRQIQKTIRKAVTG